MSSEDDFKSITEKSKQVYQRKKKNDVAPHSNREIRTTELFPNKKEHCIGLDTKTQTLTQKISSSHMKRFIQESSRYHVRCVTTNVDLKEACDGMCFANIAMISHSNAPTVCIKPLLNLFLLSTSGILIL